MILLLCMVMFSSCAKHIDPSDKKVELRTVVTGYGTFGEMTLNVGLADMEKAGFKPGDCITAMIGGTAFDLPYYTGYFTPNGELLIVDYPNSANTVITATNVGVVDRFPHMENSTIVLSLKEKGMYLDVENTLGMRYSNNREDFGSDVEFANAREVTTTGMARGILYRTASPFDNTNNRAPYVSAFLQANGVKTALNLTDNADMIARYADVPAYSKQIIDAGNVVFCKVDANYCGENFNRTLASGLAGLLDHPAPFVVHCTEGKDRTGYVCALLEALAGASYDEICADYLVTYDNYFHITPAKDPKACQLFVTLRLDDAMKFFCGIDDAAKLRSIDLSQAVRQYLLRYGMTDAQVQALRDILFGKTH